MIAPRTDARRRMPGRICALLAVTVAALTLAGCENGQNAEVLQIKDVVNGASVDVGDGLIAIRNAYATPAIAGQERVEPGDTLVLNGYVFNNSDTARDTITGASSDGTDIELGAPITIGPALHQVLGPGENVGTWRATTPVLVGANVRLTLDFARAGSVTFVIPVQPAAVSVSS